jgi:cobalamin biosynthesis Mg chelatase CobN
LDKKKEVNCKLKIDNMKKIQDLLDELDLEVSELPAPTQKRVQTYAMLEKQLVAAKLELEQLEDPDEEKRTQYEDTVVYFNEYEDDLLQSIRAYSVRLEQELAAKAMKEKREAEQKEKEAKARIQAKKEAEEKAKKSQEELEKAQAKAEEEARIAKEQAEEQARKEAEYNQPKKKSGGLGFLLAGLGIVAAVVTFGATRKD